MQARYATFTARAQARLVPPCALDLLVSAICTGEGEQPVVVLVPDVSLGDSVTVLTRGERQTWALGDAPLACDVRENGGELLFQGARLLLPGGARAAYSGRTPASGGQLSVTCPLGPGGIAVRLQMEEGE